MPQVIQLTIDTARPYEWYVISQLIDRLEIERDFQRKTSIHLATDRKSAKLVANEARARRNILLDVTYHNQADLKERFNLDGVSALSTSQAASCDPYLLSHGLLANAVANGAKVFDWTNVVKYECTDSSVTLTTDRGPRIVAKKPLPPLSIENPNASSTAVHLARMRIDYACQRSATQGAQSCAT